MKRSKDKKTLNKRFAVVNSSFFILHSSSKSRTFAPQNITLYMKGIVLAGGSERNPSIPHYERHQQAADTHFRQADDLLSDIGADAGRHTRDTDYKYSL